MKKLYSALITLFACSTLHAQQTNVVAHWMFNGNLADSSGNGMHGIGQNMVPATGVNGQPNTAYLFNGTNAYVGVSYNPLMNLTHFTYAATFKVNGFYSNTCQAEHLLKRGPESAPGDYGFLITDNANDGGSCSAFDSTKFANCFYVPGNIVTDYNTTQTVPSHQWTRVAISYNGTEIKTYINGQLDVAFPFNLSLGTSTDSLVIGRNYDNLFNYPYWFNGVMDDLIIYNEVLDDTTILTEGCGAFITVQPTDTMIWSSGTAQFTASALTATSYQWQADTGTGYIDLANSANYSGVGDDSLIVFSSGIAADSIYYRCIITNELNCKDTTIGALLSIDKTTGVIGLYANNNLRVFPNPAKDKLTITYFGKDKMQSVHIIDAQGRIILQQACDEVNTVVDLTSIATGMYLIRIYNDNGQVIATQKFVVQ